MLNLSANDFAFDPRYGYDEEKLRAVSAPLDEPADFDRFWENAYAKAQEVPLDLKLKALPCSVEGQLLLQVSYTVWPDYRVGGWLYLPENTQNLKLGIVVGHGYGGREGPDTPLCRNDRAVLLPVAPGFDLSQDPRLPRNDSSKHVLYGIESKETYLLLSCVAALWRAIDVLIEISKGKLNDFHYVGGSFGGGLGGLMLPWEKRYRSAELRQVTFAFQHFRLRNDCNGSGKAVRERWLQDPAIEEVLRYYDAATHLQKVELPIHFECALFDPSVPPPGQWAAANAHAGPKKIFAAPHGHLDYEQEEEFRQGDAHQQMRKDLFGSRIV